jgi:hypothetical protein
MVIQHSEGVATQPAEREVALEVHLPERVRCISLKALPVSCPAPFRREKVMASQDSRNRGGCGRMVNALALQQTANLATAVEGIAVTHGQDVRLHALRRSPWRARGTAATVSDLRARGVPPQPLVTRLAANPETSAQLAQVGIRQPRKGGKLRSARHAGALLPGHRTSCRHRQKVLPMSPNTCYLCLRSIQGLGGCPPNLLQTLERSSAKAMCSAGPAKSWAQSTRTLRRSRTAPNRG